MQILNLATVNDCDAAQLHKTISSKDNGVSPGAGILVSPWLMAPPFHTTECKGTSDM